MIAEVKWVRKIAVLVQTVYCPDICPDGLNKIMSNLSRGSRCLGRGSNSGAGWESRYSGRNGAIPNLLCELHGVFPESIPSQKCHTCEG